MPARFRIPVFICALVSLSASGVFAQTPAKKHYNEVKVLGGQTSFWTGRRPLTDPESLKRMTNSRGVERDVRDVLRQAGYKDKAVADAVLAAMRAGGSARNAGVCSTAAIKEGELVECNMPIGATMNWMAYRPKAAEGDMTARRIPDVRWAGTGPVEAFMFRVSSNGKTYTFVVPKPCGNIGGIDTPPELSVKKAAAQPTFMAAAPVKFTIVVSNSAPADALAATNVRLADTLPTAGGLAWSTVTPGDCKLSGEGNRSLDCQFGTLAPQESRTVEVTSTAATPYAACQAQNNASAKVTADNANPVEASASTTCVPAKLEVHKEPKGGTFTIGSPATFTITVKNSAPAGASPATSVVVADALPTNGGLEWQEAKSSVGTCSVATGHVLNCAVGTLAAQQTATITVTSKPAPFAACVAQPNPSAKATADGGLTAEDSGSLSCTPPKLVVAKTPDGGTFLQGGQATFTIVVRNDVPASASPATGVKLTDALPTNGGLTWQNATASAGKCELSGARNGNLTCDLGTIAAGQAVTITVSSPAKTPLSACQAQPNPSAKATADGGLAAEDGGSLSCTRELWFFGDAFVGKDRRVRPIAGRSTIDGAAVTSNAGAGADFAQCSPLFGVNVGVSKKMTNGWEIAGTGGVALSLVQEGRKLREHQVTLEVEANRYINHGAFIGTGLSVYDVFHSDTVTPAWLLHFGVPLGQHATHPTYFVGEGRLFLRKIDDIENNYQFWGGVRIYF